MTPRLQASRRREQVNVSVDAETFLVLRTAAARDDVSVSELLRPVLERYAKRRLRDQDLARAVEAIASSREREAERRTTRQGGASVRTIGDAPSGSKESPTKNGKTRRRTTKNS